MRKKSDGALEQKYQTLAMLCVCCIFVTPQSCLCLGGCCLRRLQQAANLPGSALSWPRWLKGPFILRHTAHLPDHLWTHGHMCHWDVEFKCSAPRCTSSLMIESTLKGGHAQRFRVLWRTVAEVRRPPFPKPKIIHSQSLSVLLQNQHWQFLLTN